jgi:threonine dehydratase
MGTREAEEPTIQEVYGASKRIQKYLFPITSRRSDALSQQFDREIWLIPECLQRTGSFKIRGALNRMLLHAERGGGPVITVSSGNHAIGMTVAASITGVECVIVVAEGASPAKVEKMKSLGADVRVMGADFDEAEHCMYEYANKFGYEIVNSFDYDVITGHGTAVLEAVRQVPGLEVLLAPVASGGLIAGCAVTMKAVNPDSHIIGVQTESWPAMHRSMAAGELVDIPGAETLADGLAGNATRSALPFRVIKRNVEEISLVCEERILQAIRHGLLNERLVLEGAGAATLAALLDGKELPGNGPVGVILSGANTTEDVLHQALA